MTEGGGLDPGVAWEWRAPSDPPLVRQLWQGKAEDLNQESGCVLEKV